MRLGLVLLAICASVADARPRRPPPDLDEFEEPRRCDRKRTWAEMRKCLGANATVLHEDDGAKLVATANGSTKSMRLYVLIDGSWRLSTYSGADDATSELLAFKRIAVGYRVDEGRVLQSLARIDAAGSSVRVWLRRRLSTVCFAGTVVCRTVITACDALVDGKSYWSFHGTLHEKDKTLFVVGDKSRAGAHCVPSRPTFRDEPVGDPLE